jgi:hypothetical protein
MAGDVAALNLPYAGGYPHSGRFLYARPSGDLFAIDCLK